MPRRAMTALPIAIILLGCIAAFAAPAKAEDLKSPVTLDISAQPLEAALLELGKQTGLQLVIPTQRLPKLTTSRISGSMSIESALRELLKGTNLTYKLVGDRTISIVQPAVQKDTPNGSSVGHLPAATRLAQTAEVEDERDGANDEPDSGSGRALDGTRERMSGIPEVLVTANKSLNTDIRRTEDDVQPYVVFDRKVIDRSGAANLDEFLKQRLPMNTRAQSRNQASRGEGATSQIDLRGLGPSQTLILIDGRRVAEGYANGSANEQPDLNGIPLAAIERIEVLPTTASGIYGGGATGGVVNVILRRDYQGAEVKLNYENTFDTDSAQRRVDLAGGFSLEGGRTNVLITGSFSDGNVLEAGDRNFAQRARARMFANNPAPILPPNTPPLGATTNIRSNLVVNGVVQPLTLDDGTPLNSTFTSVPVGYAGPAADNGAALAANAGRYNFDLAHSAQSIGGAGANRALLNNPTTESFTATLRREFTPGLHAFLELNASNREGKFVLSRLPANFTLAADAPSNPFQQPIRITVPSASGDSLWVTESDTRRVVAGVIVKLPGQWTAEADYTWNPVKSVFHDVSTGLTPAAASDMESGALDVLRDTHRFPIDFRPYLVPPLVQAPFRSLLKDATLRLAGPLGTMPAGPVMLSLLIEHRDELVEENVVPSILYRPERSQSVDSFYFELRLPLISERNARSFARELEFQVAGRRDQYRTEAVSQSGADAAGNPTDPLVRSRLRNDSNNPTVGFRFKPLEDLMLRASYGTGFFPPTIAELTPFLPGEGLTNLSDPRRGGTTVGSHLLLGGGNPDLKPEESESWSAGAVFTPRFAPQLRLSVDYTRIEKTDNRISFSPQVIVDNENLFPDLIVRGDNLPGDLPGWAGPIELLDSRLMNIARAEIEAYDVQLDYRLETEASGDIDFFALGTWQTHFKTQTLPGQPVVENVGYRGQFSTPAKFKANAGLTWNWQQWQLGWTMGYMGSYRPYAANASASSIATTILNQGAQKVPSQIYHDAFASYRFAPSGAGDWVAGLLEGMEVQLGVKNVFDTEPPFDASPSGSPYFYGYYGDPRLRTYWLGISRSFAGQ